MQPLLKSLLGLIAFIAIWFNPAGDSLTRAEILNDRLSADSLLDLASELRTNYPDSAFNIAETAMKLANKNNNIENEIEAILIQNKIHFQRGNGEKMQECLELASQLLEKTNAPLITADVYHSWAFFYDVTGQHDKRDQYSPRALKIREEENDLDGLATSYLFLGNIHFYNKDSSIYYFDKLEEVAKLQNDSLLLAKAIGSKGNFYYRVEGEFDKAIENFLKSNLLFEALGKKMPLSTGYHNLSSLYLTKEDYTNALKCGLKNLELSKEIKNVRGEASALTMIAQTYQEMDRFDDAKENMYKGIDFCKLHNLKTELAILYNNLGTNYILVDTDSAKHYLKLAVDISKEINNLRHESSALFNLAEIYRTEKEYELAEDYFLDSHEKSKSNDGTIFNFSKIQIVDFYLEWMNDKSVENAKSINFEKLEELLKSAEAYSQKNDQFRLEETLYKTYISFYKFQDDINNAAYYQDKLIVLRDSMILNSNIEIANEWAEKLKTAEKEKEIQSLEAKNKLAQFRNKVFLFALIGTILFFIILGIILSKLFKQRAEKKKIEEAQIFRSKLSSDLHDEVGSVLSSLSMQSQMMTYGASPEQKVEMEDIAKMSKEAMENLRDTVWAIDARKDKYENLVDRMIEYGEKNLEYKDFDLQVEKLNWKGKQSIDPEKRQHIFLIYKEAITNILKYSSGDIVKLRLEQKPNAFELSIHDNGTVDKNKISDGLGLSNMKMRAENMNGSLQINRYNGFEIVLNVPV